MKTHALRLSRTKNLHFAIAPFPRFSAIAQQDLQAIHRIRSELVRQRTAKANQIKGSLAEYGIVVGRQVATLRRALPELLENAENGLSFDFRALLDDLRQDLIRLDEREEEMSQ